MERKRKRRRRRRTKRRKRKRKRKGKGKEKERRARATAVTTLVRNEGRNLVPCQSNGGMVVQSLPGMEYGITRGIAKASLNSIMYAPVPGPVLPLISSSSSSSRSRSSSSSRPSSSSSSSSSGSRFGLECEGK